MSKPFLTRKPPTTASPPDPRAVQSGLRAQSSTPRPTRRALKVFYPTTGGPRMRPGPVARRVEQEGMHRFGTTRDTDRAMEKDTETREGVGRRDQTKSSRRAAQNRKVTNNRQSSLTITLHQNIQNVAELCFFEVWKM